MFFRAFLCTLVWINTGNLKSQSLIYKKISVEEGLPSSEAYFVIQSKDGYLWVGTDHGLARYDGRTFQVFTTESGLPDNTVLGLNEAYDGTLWPVTMSDKISYFDGYRFNPYRFTVNNYNDFYNRSNMHVTDMIGHTLEGRKLITTLGFREVLKEVNPNNFSYLLPIDSLPDKYYVSYVIYPLKNGALARQSYYTRTKHKNYSIIKKRDHLIINGPFFGGSAAYTDPTQKTRLLKNPLSSYMTFFRKRNGNFFGVGGDGTFIEFNDSSILGLHKVTPSRGFIEPYTDNNSKIWLASAKGIKYYQNGIGSEPEFFFKGHYISGFTQDFEGNHWFCDKDHGLYKVSSLNFRLLDFSLEAKTKRIAHFEKHNGELWFSTIEGEIWKMTKNLKTHLKYKDTRASYDFYPFKVLGDENIFLPGGLIKYKNGISPNNMPLYTAYSAMKCMANHKGKLYVGTTDGIIVFSQDGKCTSISSQSGILLGLGIDYPFNKRVTFLLADGDNIWLGAVDGLYKSVGNSYHYYGNKNPLLRNRVTCIVKKGNRLILGTKGAGVLIYNLKTKEITQYSKVQGLPSNLIKSLYLQENKLYVSSHKGLSIVHISPSFHIRGITNYNTNNVLPSDEINDITYFENRIWLATNKGVVYFDPNKTTKNTFPPPIFINSISSNDTIHKVESLDPIKLKENQRDLNIEFNGIGFNAKNRISYKYYLSNTNQDTVYTPTNEARFTNLSPGEHTFYVWAKNENGIWSSSPARLEFYIEKYFYEYLAFQILALLLILSLLVYGTYITFKRKNLKKQTDLEYKKKVSDLELRSMRASMNPHFIFNSLNSIQYYYVENDIKSANHYLSKFSGLIRKILNTSLNSFISLEKEIELLEEYLELESMRLRGAINYSIKYDPAILNQDIQLPQMLLQPLVENAVLHGIPEGGWVEIRFEIHHAKLIIEIEDNGIGKKASIEKRKKRKDISLGTKITEHRIQLLENFYKEDIEYSITDKSEIDSEQTGTLVRIKLPLNNL